MHHLLRPPRGGAETPRRRAGTLDAAAGAGMVAERCAHDAPGPAQTVAASADLAPGLGRDRGSAAPWRGWRVAAGHMAGLAGRRLGCRRRGGRRPRALAPGRPPDGHRLLRASHGEALVRGEARLLASGAGLLD